MKKGLLIYIFLFIGFWVSSQVMLNNGAYMNAQSGAFIHVNGSVQNADGEINIDQIGGVPAELFISEDITNDAMLTADGYIILHGNWFNNSNFASVLGTVFLEGQSQLISGSVESNFFNLTLDGSGLKTQQINSYAHGILDLKHLELQTELNTFFVENTSTDAIQRTTGFVSSLNGGFLSRRTDALDTYLFPVGSSLGSFRYRPVELTPNSDPNNTFEVRLANLDANSEGFDRSLTDEVICTLNPLYYHQLNRSIGNSDVDLNIYFDEIEDGNWGGISNWKQNNTQWEYIANSTSLASAPLSIASTLSWNDFDDLPYILSHINEIPIFDSIGPICHNTAVPDLPSVSLNGYSGTWSGTINAAQTGIQTFTFIPDPNQCSFSAELSVMVSPLPEITGVQEVQEILCFGGMGSIEVLTINSGMMYAMDGAGMVSSNQFDVLSGMHSISVMDDNGCISDHAYEMMEPLVIETQASVEHILCPGGSGSIDLTISGGSPSYDVAWNDSLFTEDATGLSIGLYSALITDSNGCQDSIEMEIIETLSGEEFFIQNTSGTTEINCLVSQIEVEAIGGLNYNWSGGTSLNTSWNTLTESGNYILSYIDSNGCDLQINFVVSEDFTTPIIQVENITNLTDELNCIEPQIELIATGGQSFVWGVDGPSGSSLFIDEAGEYVVVGSGVNGCIDSATISISSDFELPIVTIQNLSNTNVLDCNTFDIELLASGGLGYNWDNDLGSNPSVIVSNGGVFTVYAVGINGCVNSDSIEIIEVPFPTLTVNSETICSGQSIELVAEASIPGGNFTWSNSLGVSSSVSVSPNSNAFYSVDYELNGCSSNTAIAIISVLPTPFVTISGDNSICSSESVTLTGTPSLPGGIFQWLPGNEIENSITYFPAETTNYGLVYTLNGCPSDITEFTVEVIPTPVVSVSDISICLGEEGTLIAQPSLPGGTYNWIASGDNLQSISESPDSTTSYSVLYTLNGCSSQMTSAVINVNPVPELSIEDIGICEGESGFLNAIASIDGGVYSWNGYNEYSSELEVSPLISTNYAVSYELNNCSSSLVYALVTVTEQPELSYVNEGICEGETISISVSPSVPGGEFIWLPGNETTQSITVSPIVTTEYQVMYQINGCQTDYETLTVSVDAMPQASFDVNMTTGCAPLNIVFTNTTGNTTGCLWSIDNGSTLTGCQNTSYTFYDEGCYSITLVTETPNGCPGIITMENLICVLPAPEIDFSMSTNQIAYGSSEVSFMNNSTNAVDYLWDFGDGSLDSLFSPASYEYDVNDEESFLVSLTGTTDLGCSDSLQLLINVNQDAVIFAPNSFTPDGDGLNDSWFPTISTGIAEDFFMVQVFNRWGELVFEAKDFYSSWDGTYQGNRAQIGTYTYTVRYKRKQTEERKVMVGHINLVR